MKNKHNKPELFIHIGTHKTGSSAIQNALHKCEVELKREKIIYIHSNKLFESMINLEKLDQNVIDEAKKYILKIIKSKKPGLKYIISCEYFSGNPDIGYKNAVFVAENLRKFTNDFNVYIIVYLRRQDLFVESLYTQKIQQGGSISFNDFIDSFDSSYFSWKLLLDDYKKYFGRDNIVVRRYGKEFFNKNSDIIKDFASIIDSNTLRNLEEMKVGNPGLTRDALEIARLCNKSFNGLEKKKLRSLLQYTNARKLFENFSFFNNEERKKFLSNYEKSNSAVARKYLKEPTGILFPIKKDIFNNKDYEGLSLEKIIVVLMRSLVSGLDMQYNESIFLKTNIKIENKLKKIIRKNYILKKIFKRLIKK
jgi:hypothetical protein